MEFIGVGSVLNSIFPSTKATEQMSIFQKCKITLKNSHNQSHQRINPIFENFKLHFKKCTKRPINSHFVIIMHIRSEMVSNFEHLYTSNITFSHLQSILDDFHFTSNDLMVFYSNNNWTFRLTLYGIFKLQAILYIAKYI